MLPVRISGAAAPTQLGSLDLLDDVLGPAIDQDLVERLIAADRDVFLNVVRIDEAAVAQDNFLLAFEEWDFVPRRHLRIAVAVLDVRSDVVPLFDLAIDQVGGDDLPMEMSWRMRVHRRLGHGW